MKVYRKRTIFGAENFIDNPELFADYVANKLKIIGVKHFDVDKFSAFYPESILHFKYINDLQKFINSRVDKKETENKNTNKLDSGSVNKNGNTTK